MGDQVPVTSSRIKGPNITEFDGFKVMNCVSEATSNGKSANKLDAQDVVLKMLR